MERFVIRGGNKLNGKITISGAKNAALPIIAASVFAGEPCRIENVPEISDVRMMGKILRYIGAEVTMPEPGVMVVDSKNVKADITIPDEMTRKLRASYYLLGALLSNFGKACVALPGGCYFGVRPIDQHIKGFEALGAKVDIENALVNVQCDELYGSSIYLDVVSVGATINVMLAAVKAKGLTVIENAAREPHIVDLANFLNSMGANISGAGTDTIKIKGVESLHGTTYAIIPDMIEAGTYMTAVAATGGELTLCGVIPKHMESVTAKLQEIGVTVIEDDSEITVRSNRIYRGTEIKTNPYPGFPTDMQPQIAALLSLAQGTSIVTDSVWNSRFRYTDEFKRMGAQIQVDGNLAIIEGVERLTGAQLEACDLRAGAAMVIAGLAAQGVTEIDAIYQRIADSDIIVDIAAGNEGTSSYDNMWGTDLNLSAHPDNATISSQIISKF